MDEVNHALGKKVELVPLNSALRLENLEEDMKTVPMYSLRIKSMATTIYFNSHTQVVRIE